LKLPSPSDRIVGAFCFESAEVNVLDEVNLHESKGPTSSRLLLGLLSYLLVVFFPSVLAVLADPEILASGSIYATFAISGISAYSIFAIQFVLAARFRSLLKLFGAPAILRLHRSMAIVATGFVFLHSGLLLWAKGSWDLLLSPWVGWPIQRGRIAVLALLVTVGISMGRKRIPINNADWRFFHGILAWTILLCGFLHSVVLGSSFKSPAFAIAWIAYFAVAVLGALARRERGKRRRAG